jgi:secreted trypsin-like serine protease
MKRLHIRSVAVVLIVVVAAVAAVVAVRSSQSDDSRDRNIAGGGDVTSSAVPYQVSLISWNVSNGVRTTGGGVCGGTIISEYWVLTADHCLKLDDVTKQPVPSEIYVGSGDPNFDQSIFGPGNGRRATVAYRFRDVAGDVPGLDLALLKVSRPFTYSKTVQPAALPVGLDEATWPSISQVGLITGWGKTLADDGQTTLKGVELKVNNSYTSDYCQDDTNKYDSYFGTIYRASQHLCLIRTSTDVQAAACSGDSGGPFAIKVGDKTYVAGVASKATSSRDAPFNFCTGVTPSLYTRVTAGLDWIIPGVVTDLNARTDTGRVDLSWGAPTHSPFSAITDYQVDMRAVGASEWSTVNDGVSTSMGASIIGLNTGDALEFRVSAINAVSASNAGLRQFANFTVTVGVPPTSTSTTTTSTTAPATTTTLAPQSITIAPSTTARAVSIVGKTTTTSSIAPATSVAVPRATTTVAPVASSGGASIQPVGGNDRKFESPPVPAGLTPQPLEEKVVVASVGPQPVIGSTWSATDVAKTGNVNLPTGGLVSVAVPAKSSKVCKSNGSGLTMVGKGTCKATVSVTIGSGKPKKKTVSIKVS